MSEFATKYGTPVIVGMLLLALLALWRFERKIDNYQRQAIIYKESATSNAEAIDQIGKDIRLISDAVKELQGVSSITETVRKEVGEELRNVLRKDKSAADWGKSDVPPDLVRVYNRTGSRDVQVPSMP